MASIFSWMFKKSNKSLYSEFKYLSDFQVYNKGCELKDNKEYDEALKYFDYSIERGISDAFRERGDCLKSLGYYLDAINDYTKAIEDDPDDCNLYFCRGIAKHTTGDFAGAISDKYLAIEYSKLKTEINANRDKTAQSLGANSVTDYYELYMSRWEQDLSLDISMKDRIRKFKESGSEMDMKAAASLERIVNLKVKEWKRR